MVLAQRIQLWEKDERGITKGELRVLCIYVVPQQNLHFRLESKWPNAEYGTA